MLLLEYPKCSTCKKAEKYLQNQNVVYQKRHIVEERPDEDELKQWVELSGLPLKKFFNTSGLKYRELDLKNRLSTMSEEDQIQLLASDGMLVKRPLLVGDNFVKVGFKEVEWNLS